MPLYEKCPCSLGNSSYGLDKFSGQVFKKLLDFGMFSSGVLSKFQAPLSNAISKGPAAIATTNYILQKNIQNTESL